MGPTKWQTKPWIAQTGMEGGPGLLLKNSVLKLRKKKEMERSLLFTFLSVFLSRGLYLRTYILI